MTAFYEKMIDSFIENINNNHFDNHDIERFGAAPKKQKSVLKQTVKHVVLKDRISIVDLKHYLPGFLKALSKYATRLESFYDSLADEESKKLLIDLVSFRLLGNEKIKLKTNTVENQETLRKIKRIQDKTDIIDPQFLHFKLNKFDLNNFGKDVKLYFTATGIFSDFFLEQYRYKTATVDISVCENDVVIDAGGCWGDTAIYFADCAGEGGSVFSFEFIPNNIEIFQRNRDLNPRLSKQVKIIDRPLWEASGQKIFYRDFGPGSKVEFENFEEADGSTETISIDDFITQQNVLKVDFIKMDIEGSEQKALNGAIQTIKKHKPNLAISIYHSWDDFVDIPKWISDLNLGYKLYLGHYTIHAEETVIFATVK